jgi:hypothetical protein
VQVAVDAAELVIGLEHPGGAPAQGYGLIAPALDVLGVLPANLKPQQNTCSVRRTGEMPTSLNATRTAGMREQP